MDKKRLVDGTTALAEKRPRVIKIEPAERPQNVRLRVAAYTRVSSDSEDQLNSFAAQNRYYTELISGKAEWRMVDIYADEGITGTSVAKRDDFQRMMADCRRGLIDQILVKSISRFARNTKDCLQNIRELKELGVNVRFEREGIDTVNVSSELITAIYAAFAQKESESISGNMRWSYQRRMESGTFLPSSMAYGYRLDGKKIVIDPEAALIVSRIFQWYLSGVNKTEIAKRLNEEGVPSGQQKQWYHFFTMGGAKSHDTEDGILEPGAPDFERKLLMLQRKPRARYRINHISWWAQEMPSEEEYAEARKNLAKVDWAVDYVITHCAPTSIALMENRHNEADPLTDFLQEVKERAHYHYWLFGHYHDNRAIDEKHILLWEQIVQVI